MHNENSSIWELAPLGIAQVADTGRFLAVNPRFCQITGYSESELLDRTFHEITHPADVKYDAMEAGHLVSDRTSDGYHMVKRYISKDGRVVWVNLQVHAVRTDDGSFRHFLSFAIELIHISVGHCDTPSSNPAGKANPVWEYIRKNPRESLIVGTALIAVAQGKNIFELLESLLGSMITK